MSEICYKVKSGYGQIRVTQVLDSSRLHFFLGKTSKYRNCGERKRMADSFARDM